MKNLKRVAWFVVGTISSATFFFIARRIQKEKKGKQEHKIILALLRSNEDIMKIEDPGKTGIKYIKHPKSKKYDDKNFQWNARINNVIIIPLHDDKFLIPPNKDKQFNYYFHERGHLKNKNKGHFKRKKTCGYNVSVCLRKELEAELNVIENSKKIGKKFEKGYWQKNFNFLQKQCRKCLALIIKNKCPESEMKKIEECLNIIDQAVKIKPRKIIFGERKK